METTDAHLIRATLEGICFQTKDVLQSMESDTGHPITALNVDGGMAVSDTFLQILANICHLPVGKSYLHPSIFRSKPKCLHTFLSLCFRIFILNDNCITFEGF